MKNLNANFIRKQASLNALQQQLTQYQKMTTHLVNCLPEEWQAHCQVVRLDPYEKKLVLSTDEQNLVTSLRYMHPQLLSHVRKKPQLFRDIELIETIYTPQIKLTKKIKPNLLKSEEAADACQLAAENCPPALQKALMRLGETLRRRK